MQHHDGQQPREGDALGRIRRGDAGKTRISGKTTAPCSAGCKPDSLPFPASRRSATTTAPVNESYWFGNPPAILRFLAPTALPHVERAGLPEICRVLYIDGRSPEWQVQQSYVTRPGGREYARFWWNAPAFANERQESSTNGDSGPRRGFASRRA